MAKVTIVTEGIGLFYFKDELWKVIFPFDEECHRVNFTFQKNGEKESKPIALAQPNRQITVNVKNPSPTSLASTGSSLDDFIDLTASYSHSDGVRLIDNWQEKAVFMTIPNAKFSVREVTKEVFVLSENDSPKLIQKLGSSAKSEIELDADGILTISDENGTEIFSTDQDADYVLTFNNDCKNSDMLSTGDFEMVYNVVEDKVDNTRKFEESRYAGTMTMTKDRGLVLMSDTPFNTTRDLPCHKVRISLTDGLF